MQRRKKNSSKVNLIVSAVFHTVVVVGIVFLAAREGMLGNQMKTLAVTMAPKPKPPEQPKEKPAEPKTETAKQVDTPKTMTAPPPRLETAAAPPPPANDTVAAAPAAVNLAAFDFNDGAKEVQTMSDPNQLYKATVERALRSRWNRPDDMEDEQYVAEVELAIDSKGIVTGTTWVKGSGNARWDASVKAAVAATKSISTAPPKNFPGTFKARFDVEAARTEEIIQTTQVRTW